MWVHARYNWHVGTGPDDGYWRLQEPTTTFVTCVSDADTVSTDPSTRTFAFPCYVDQDMKMKFDLPQTRQEIDWRTMEQPTGGTTLPPMGLSNGKCYPARHKLPKAGIIVRDRLNTRF